MARRVIRGSTGYRPGTRAVLATNFDVEWSVRARTWLSGKTEVLVAKWFRRPPGNPGVVGARPGGPRETDRYAVVYGMLLVLPWSSL